MAPNKSMGVKVSSMDSEMEFAISKLVSCFFYYIFMSQNYIIVY